MTLERLAITGQRISLRLDYHSAMSFASQSYRPRFMLRLTKDIWERDRNVIKNVSRDIRNRTKLYTVRNLVLMNERNFAEDLVKGRKVNFQPEKAPNRGVMEKNRCSGTSTTFLNQLPYHIFRNQKT